MTLNANHLREFSFGSLTPTKKTIRSSELIRISRKEKTFVAYNGNNVFPVHVDLVSDKTGVIVRFVADDELAIQHEFWDGLQSIYKTTDPACEGYELVLLSECPF